MQVSVESAAKRLASPGGFVPVVAVTTLIALNLLLFLPTTTSMVETWRNFETFHHGFAVIPIVIWLIWTDRSRLATTPAAPCWPGLIAVAALGMIWLLGVVGAAQVVSQFALIGLVSASLLTVFGMQWIRALWFPLLFMIFAVPFGEAALPILMDWTADVTVWAVRLSGVPVHQEGMHFVLPSGRWSVIEACSGLKFLVASIMIGSLYAWLMYRSMRRRLVFLMVAIAMPVVANWLRAYSIVMGGHLTENRLMTGEDHIVFGWILFGMLLFAAFWIGARWREDNGAQQVTVGSEVVPAWQGIGKASLILVLLLSIWPVLGYALMKPLGSTILAEIRAPAALDGWERDGASSAASWIRELQGSTSKAHFAYRKDGHVVALFIAAYENQTQTAQVGSSANVLPRAIGPDWVQITDPNLVETGARSMEARQVQIRNKATGAKLLLWQLYRVEGRWTSSPARTKVALALDRLLRRRDTAFWVALSTPVETNAAEAQLILQAFAREMGPALERALDPVDRQ